MLQSKNTSIIGGLGTGSELSVDGFVSHEASSDHVATECISVTAWGDRWLTRREREGVRSIADDRRIWRVHVLAECWASGPLSKVTRSDARDWFTRLAEKSSSNPTHLYRPRKLAAQTVKNVLQVVRKCFGDACECGWISLNPFEGLRLPRSRLARDTHPWTVLTLTEQHTAAAVLPTIERLIFLFSLGSGLRQSEQWALRLTDIHLDGEPWIDVRRGTLAGPTKGGSPRRVPLFGVALVAIRDWLHLLPAFESVTTTERYAHWLQSNERLFRVAKRMRVEVPSLGDGDDWIEEETSNVERGLFMNAKKEVSEVAVIGSHLRDLNSRPTVYETVGDEVAELKARNDALVRALRAAEEDATAQRELNSQLCRTVQRLTSLAARAAAPMPFIEGERVKHKSGISGSVVGCTKTDRGWLVRVSFGDAGEGIVDASELSS